MVQSNIFKEWRLKSLCGGRFVSRVHLLFWRSTQRYYCPQGCGRSAEGSARDWRWMRRWGNRREWRTQGRRDTLIMWWPWDDAHNLSHDVVCRSWRPEPDYWTVRRWDHACIIHVLRFMCAVWKVLWVLVVTLSLVSCVLSLGFTTQAQYQVQSSSLLDFVVQLCTCSQTLYSVIVNFILLHTCIAKTGHLRCCLYTPRRVQ